MPTSYPYWKKQTKPLFEELDWNIPEQKTSHVTVVGGNSQNFANVVKISEFLSTNFPIKTVETILPDALRKNFPAGLPDLTFLPSTASGSFDRSPLLAEAIADSDFIFLAGELTKNSITAVAIADALKSIYGPESPTFSLDTPATIAAPTALPLAPRLLITRDSADLLLAESEFLLSAGTFYVVSMAQLQKIFRAVYYPKVLMLSSPLAQVVETLHKFTLTYPATILTFHEGQILVASDGKIISTPIETTNYTPISLWSGELASRVLAMNLFTPGQPLAATAAAILK